MSITFRWSADCKALRELVVMKSGSIAIRVIGVTIPSNSESLCMSVGYTGRKEMNDYREVERPKARARKTM
jgi:hypothetical protein